MLVLGFIAGFCSSSLGIGGGIVIVPALVLLFDNEIKKVIGVSLATIVPTALVGIATHYIIKSSNIRLLVALFVIIGSIVGAKFGARVANKISSKILKGLFALLLLFVGLKLMGIITIPTKPISSTTTYFLLIVLGLLAGSASALFGIGGGAVIVPGLNLFFGLPMHEAIATSLTVVLPTAFAGVIFHKEFDNVDTETVKFLIPTALIGAVFGAIVTNSLPSVSLKIIFGVLMIFCSIKIFLQKEQAD